MSAAERMLRQGIVELKLDLPETAIVQLLEYLALLQKWNRVFNLTAIRDPQQMVTHHLLDSLAVLPHLWPGRWLDVGCGAGLPGVVLAIARPQWSFTLLDSNSKKTGFVQQSVIQLGLNNVEVQCTRVEQWQPPELFDGIISRAFSELVQFLRCSQHLLAANGRWAAMKGEPEQELQAVVDPVYRIEQVLPLTVPFISATRSLVLAGCAGSEEK